MKEKTKARKKVTITPKEQIFDQYKADLIKQIPVFAERIAPIYIILNWQWVDEHDHRYIPTADHIKNTLTRLIQDIETGGYRRVSTGGLHVESDDEGMSMSFSFGVDSDGGIS